MELKYQSKVYLILQPGVGGTHFNKKKSNRAYCVKGFFSFQSKLYELLCLATLVNFLLILLLKYMKITSVQENS
jgi:hypothetical protein